MNSSQTMFYLKRNWYFILLGCITIFMHCFMIDNIPFGLHVDEVGMGYDAWSLANFGVDRYLKSYPVYLTNFGGGQSALYCYVCMIFVKLFGLSTYTIRIPAILFAGLTVIFGMKILMKIWKNNRTAMFVFLALYTIIPYFTMSSRFGLDCNLMLGTSTVFLYSLILAIDKQKHGYFLLAGLTGGIVLYSYALSYVVMPIFLLMALSYLFYTKKIKLPHLLEMGVIMGIIGSPLIMVQLINMYNLPELKLGSITFTKLLFYRSGELALTSLVPNALEVVKSIFFYDWLEYNTFSDYYTLYWISIPFAILGISRGVDKFAKSIHNRQYDPSSFILIWMGAEFFMGCMLVGDSSNTNKMNGIFFCILFFTVDGILWLYESRFVWRKRICYLAFGIYLLSFISFFHYYFFEYKTDRYPQLFFDHTYEQAYEYVQYGQDGVLANLPTYIVSDLDNYVYFLVSSKTSPYDFNILSNGTESYKNYTFKPPVDMDPNAVYIVAQSKTDYLNALSSLGFVEEKKGTHYVCHKID